MNHMSLHSCEHIIVVYNRSFHVCYIYICTSLISFTMAFHGLNLGKRPKCLSRGVGEGSGTARQSGGQTAHHGAWNRSGFASKGLSSWHMASSRLSKT